MADCRSGVSATRPLTMVGASMPETKMDSAKSTSTPWKVFGRCCAPGCGRTAASRRRSCPTISPSSNSCTTPDVGAKPYSEPCWPPCCPPPRNPNRAGFVCPGCGGKRGHLLRSRAYTYECVACGKQTSVTAGTVMHRTNLPLTVWFWAAHLMATHSNGMSAQQLMGQLGLGSDKTAWLLAQKRRRSMVDPEREPLKGVVEIDQSEMPFRADETFFEITKSGKMLVIGAVEIVDHTKPQEPKRFGAKYLDTMSGRWPRS